MPPMLAATSSNVSPNWTMYQRGSVSAGTCTTTGSSPQVKPAVGIDGDLVRRGDVPVRGRLQLRDAAKHVDVRRAHLPRIEHRLRLHADRRTVNDHTQVALTPPIDSPRTARQQPFHPKGNPLDEQRDQG